MDFETESHPPHVRSHTRFEERLLRWVVFCALAATLGCRAPSPDWNGMWKLNPSKSSFHGPTFTISISADGEYGYDDGSSRFTFRCDGKDRSVEKNRTRSCVKSNATALELTQKENGVKTSVSHWELSGDGNVLMSTAPRFVRVVLLLQLRLSLRECRVLMTLLASGGTRPTSNDMPI